MPLDYVPIFCHNAGRVLIHSFSPVLMIKKIVPDLLALIGLALLGYGLFLFDPRASYIICGGLMLCGGVMMGARQ